MITYAIIAKYKVTGDGSLMGEVVGFYHDVRWAFQVYDSIMAKGPKASFAVIEVKWQNPDQYQARGPEAKRP